MPLATETLLASPFVRIPALEHILSDFPVPLVQPAHLPIARAAKDLHFVVAVGLLLRVRVRAIE